MSKELLRPNTTDNQTWFRGLREAKLSTAGTTLAESFVVERDFYEKANTLRTQFERHVSSASSGSGESALVYTYSPNGFQCLTASAERVFGWDDISAFLERLRAWAVEKLGVTHASTPWIRIYINGCGRAAMRDSVNAKWHYLLSLTRNLKGKTGGIKVLVEPGEGGRGGVKTRLVRVLTLKPGFNPNSEIRRHCSVPIR